MLSFIRNSKLSYAVFNFFNKEKLNHNISLYQKYGLKKKYYSPISSKDFEGIKESYCRREDNDKVRNSDFFKNLSEENKESLLDFHNKGYCIIRGFLNNDTVDEVNNEIQRLVDTRKIKFRYANKLMFAIHHSKLIEKIGQNKYLLDVLSILFDGKAKLFQSINFINGSEQKTHSDSIHMTTFPHGGLLGVWVALEDVSAENGALHYYPESHKLPYFMNSDYDNEGTKFMLGKKGYKEYEEFLNSRINDLKLEKKVFDCKKGDMLIWHANILHGGEPHTNKNRTRKSMVFHYFDENSICYHEITQRPALFKN
ncbi:phytanoyl-CoA dioxygenase family protein [Chryseobacterium sp.]|uniref:phytanoyl-CoA dioxygenase family protein n=1 Tax=Chryseobacterium sp. TaxID=1871047 RepID=UPI0011C8DEF5|nr:phytanoyl-CoA dioxygenase family protein [Chryseobacterium sp.]TXF77318.1 phytanoyl-CoA dioxygenase family protein [Chryseobacterium sp.]